LRPRSASDYSLLIVALLERGELAPEEAAWRFDDAGVAPADRRLLDESIETGAARRPSIAPSALSWGSRGLPHVAESTSERRSSS
jgi:hypothetical protein